MVNIPLAVFTLGPVNYANYAMSHTHRKMAKSEKLTFCHKFVKNYTIFTK